MDSSRLKYVVGVICLLQPILGIGNMPDASQEGILKQYRSYEDVALFHFSVPPETTRATWEFASFQNDPACAVRDVHIWIQHGSFPVAQFDNSTFSRDLYTERTSLHLVETKSACNPHDSTIFPVYNPIPGTRYAAAYLTPFEEKIIQQGIHRKCRYSQLEFGLSSDDLSDCCSACCSRNSLNMEIGLVLKNPMEIHIMGCAHFTKMNLLINLNFHLQLQDIEF